MRDSLSVLCTLCAVLFSVASVSECVNCYTLRNDSTCSQGGSCVSEHPPHNEQQQCSALYPLPESEEMPSYMRECPKDTLGESPSYLRCNETVINTVKSDRRYILVTSVSSELLSLDPQHFAMNVSWYYRDFVMATTLPPPSKRLRGYEVRVRRNDTVVGCWCILDRNVSGVTIGTGLAPRFQYKASTTMKVEVLTLPYDPLYLDSLYLTSQEYDWPSECNDHDLTRSADTCTPPLLPSPASVRVNTTLTGDSTKQLTVVWSHSTPAPPPHIYYVYGVSDQGNFSVVVNGTQQVSVSGLNASGTYTVWVQGYSHCAGTSAFLSSGFTKGIGCGGLSDGVTDPPLPTTLGHVTMTTTQSSPTQPLLSSTTDLPHHPYHPVSLLVALLLSGLALLVAVGSAVCVVLGVLRCRHNRSPHSLSTGIMVEDAVWSTGYKYTPVTGLPKVKPDILVLYSLKTPNSEQELIERCVVARLKQDYHVNSCNDHTEKTVMQWVEEQARHAHSVLIVCNESFHGEWSSQDRGPLLNSLNAIINSAASHDNISKFATVLLDSDSSKFIPDNLYIRGMSSFVIDEKARDMEDFLEQNSKSQR